MEDQVRQLNDIDIGIPAFAYHRRRGRGVHATGPEGNFVLVYGSPGCLLSTESWRSIFDCERIQKDVNRSRF